MMRITPKGDVLLPFDTIILPLFAGGVKGFAPELYTCTILETGIVEVE